MSASFVPPLPHLRVGQKCCDFIGLQSVSVFYTIEKHDYSLCLVVIVGADYRGENRPSA
jgi:hypothetical protein